MTETSDSDGTQGQSRTDERQVVDDFISAAEVYAAQIEALAAMAYQNPPLSREAEDQTILPAWDPAMSLPHTLLPLYAAGLRIIELSEAYPTYQSRPREDDPGRDILVRLQAVFGEYDLYVTSSMAGPNHLHEDWPLQRIDEAELTMGSLAGDLAEVYMDVVDGLIRLRAGQPIEEVVSDWRVRFVRSWGWHAINALRIIHAYLCG